MGKPPTLQDGGGQWLSTKQFWQKGNEAIVGLWLPNLDEGRWF
jgi:hypothetical protein